MSDQQRERIWQALSANDRATLCEWLRGGTVPLMALDFALGRVALALREAEGREEET